MKIRLERFAVVGVVGVSLLAASACADSNPTSPSPAASTASDVVAQPAARAGAGALPNVGGLGDGPAVTAINFPPRNEPNQFFSNLTTLYRDELRRPQTAPTNVDPEGQNVWLTEYFRYSLNGCTHVEAVRRTLLQITSGITEPVCGQETPTFPPRNLPFEFQLQLENTYRDVLRRPQILSYLDSEGANVWLAQYLRFRVSGCSHIDAQTKVFTEIRGGGVQPACTPAAPPQVINDFIPEFGQKIHDITVSTTGRLVVSLTWADSSIDLDLFLTAGPCRSNCTVLRSSEAVNTNSERVEHQVRAGESYTIWVESFSLLRSTSYRIEYSVVPSSAATASLPGQDDVTQISEGVRLAK